MIMERDAFFMQAALKEAKTAKSKGEVPVGAVLVVDNEIVATAHNEKESTNDPTAHAEILVIKRATISLGRWRLDDATLYVTLEPCAMCAGAIVQARIKRLVYGATDVKAGAVGSIYDLVRDSRFNHWVEVSSGVLQEECSLILKTFFDELR